MQNVVNGSRKVSFRLHPFLRGTASRRMQFIDINPATVYRLETSAGQCFDRAVRDLTPRNTKFIASFSLTTIFHGSAYKRISEYILF